MFVDVVGPLLVVEFEDDDDAVAAANNVGTKG